MRQFVEILEQQLEGYRQLLELAEEKQILLIGNDINQLDQLNKREQKLLLQLTKLENQRLQIVQSLEEQFGNPGVTMSLKEIVESAPDPYQTSLNNIYIELNELIAKLDKLNQENAGLIQQALKYVNFTIDILAKDEREVTYTQGEKGTKNQSRIFDQKA